MSAPAVVRVTAPLDADRAVLAWPLLRVFNEAGLLTAADVQVAQRLGRLGRETDERVMLAAAFAVASLRAGSVCLTLGELRDRVAGAEVGGADVDGAAAELPWPDPAAWSAAVTASPLTARGPTDDPDRPLRWVDDRLYLDRYWRQEQVVRREMDRRTADVAAEPDPALLRAALDRVFAPTVAMPGRADPEQVLAAAAALVGRLTVLTGGPGTGKTTTVARLIAVLRAMPGAPVRVALAAPTGKAAARLQEAVREAVADLPQEDRDRVGELSASTLHRLLGWTPAGGSRFRHHRTNHLPHDLVVVDETSMVSLTMMSRLLEALRPEARLVLVGDADQLASVDAGAVLGDLVARPPTARVLGTAVRRAVPSLAPADGTDPASSLDSGVVRLVTDHRFGSQIGKLAAAVRDGRADDVMRLLTDGGEPVRFVETDPDAELTDDDVRAVRADVVGTARDLGLAASAGDAARALEALEGHRLLLAHRTGPAGVQRWTERIEGWLVDEGLAPRGQGEWWLGRPLLVTTNDPDSRLYNGDTGVVVRAGDGVVAAFGTPGSELLVRTHRLPPVQTVHAMTVHRGQGSQFRTVSLVLPGPESPLLTRELLYTAITRAQEVVRVVGSEAAVRAAVGHQVRRASGLRFPLSGR